MSPSTPAVSLLRQRMLDDMRLRKLQPQTQEAYIYAVLKLAAYLTRPARHGNGRGAAQLSAASRRHGNLARQHRRAISATSKFSLAQNGYRASGLVPWPKALGDCLLWESRK